MADLSNQARNNFNELVDKFTATDDTTQTSAKKLFRVTGDDGEPVEEPVLLNVDGTRLENGEKPVYTEYSFYLEIDFSLFRLPDLTQTL